MREPPDLAGEAIVGALQTGFGIRVAGLSFLPVGNDADSWAFRVEAADGPDWFLKVRSGTGAMPGAAVPAYLHRRGTPGVLAPLPTRAREPYLVVDRFALALYPMLDGRHGAEVGLTPAQWRELGATVARVHATPANPELLGLVGQETFRPSRRELLPELEEALAAADPADPVAGRLAASWQAHRAVIDRLVDQADHLGRQLSGSPTPQVLCHADLHTWNVLIETTGRLWIADWDEAVLAPRERDLMFVVGGIGHGLVSPSDTASFLDGYGQVTVDPTRLAYYRCAWAVQDIAAYGEQALLSPTAGEPTRQAAVEGFEDLFAPGNIVDLATGQGPGKIGVPDL
jgi:spectinomycin phosphotransferase